MAEITYVGNLAGLRVGAIVLPRGEAIEVPDELADDLLKREDFKAANKPKPKAGKVPKTTGVNAE